MDVYLRILNGRLRRGAGTAGVKQFRIYRNHFSIGSNSACNMCCKSRSVSDRHCMIYAEKQGIFVQDLKSTTGTFVNGVRVHDFQPLHHGDALKIGRLEFEVVLRERPPAVELPSTDARTHSMSETSPGRDTVDSAITEMLEAADDEERERRLNDPSSRYFAIAEGDSPQAVVSDEDAHEVGKESRKRPERKPPSKLPPPPKLTANDTVEAAEKALDKIFRSGR